MSLDELTQDASSIVHGRVLRSWSAWDLGRTTIWTHYEIAVDDAWKGAPGKTLVVSEPGGEVDGVHLRVPGAPQYSVGEEIVVFAAAVPVGYLRTCGWAQGRFLVETASDTPSGKRVKTDLTGVTLAESQEGKTRVVQKYAGLDGQDLGQFRQLVESILESQTRSEQ